MMLKTLPKILFMLFLFFSGNLAMMDYFNFKMCSAGGELKDLNTHPERRATIFHDITFNCEGRIGSWEYYAVNPNKVFYAAVWRQNPETKRLHLVGYNTIKPTKTGYGIHHVAKSSADLHVRPGDMIGFHYPFENKQRIVIPVENDESASRYSTYDMGIKEMRHGYSVKPNEKQAHGFPALRAQVLSTEQNLRLSGGNRAFVGRAEIKNGNTYGTICDLWWKKRGWPLLFCLQLGYPNVTYANQTKNVNKKYSADQDTPIHVYNPHCKTSENITVQQCTTHPKITNCTHDEDMFIVCEPKIRLTHRFWSDYKAQKEGEGEPLIYRAGEWKIICDNRTVEWHIDNRNTSWITAACRELGFPGFDSIEARERGNMQTGMAIPICNNKPANPPNVLDQCESSVSYDECKHTTYQITCQPGTISDWAN